MACQTGVVRGYPPVIHKRRELAGALIENWALNLGLARSTHTLTVRPTARCSPTATVNQGSKDLTARKSFAEPAKGFVITMDESTARVNSAGSPLKDWVTS